MDRQIAMKWVEALRSGEYKQGKGNLKQDGNFCCLGVLCDISKQGEWESVKVNGSLNLIRGYYDGFTSYLPTSVEKWAGISSSNGLFLDEKNWETSLSSLNDKGHSFEEIADIIEKHWEHL